MENNPFEDKRPAGEEQNTAPEAENMPPLGSENSAPEAENSSSQTWSSPSGSYTEPPKGPGYQQNQSYYQQNQGYYQENQGWYQNPPYQTQTKKPASRLANVSLILGILSLVGVCCCVVPAVILGIAGFITAMMAKKQEGVLEGRALAGLILSIIGFALGVAGVLILGVAYYAVSQSGGSYVMNSSEFEQFMEEFQNGNFRGYR